MSGRIYYKTRGICECTTKCNHLNDFIFVGSVKCQEDRKNFIKKGFNKKGKFVVCRMEPGIIKTFFVWLAEFIIVRVLMRGLRFMFLKIITFLEWIKR